MKLVHLADLHLGFRRFDRVDESGRNVRERDVMKTFAALIDQVIEVAPDVVVVAGDVFHSKTPANTIVVEAFAGFARLMTALPNLTCILVGGNHDAPVDRAMTCILRLFEQLGVRVVEHDAARVDVPALELSVLCVPDRTGMKAPALEPNPDAKYNVLVLHGEVGDHAQRYTKESGDTGLCVSLEDIGPDRWTYVALGHYHVYDAIAPNVFYTGATDYTSSDPWREIRDEAAAGITGKRFIERDLATGAHTVHELPRSRDHIDLLLDADGMDEIALAAALTELLEDAWPDDAICRVVVANCTVKPSALQQHVDGWAKTMRQYKARALNLQIDFRKPVIIRAGTQSPIRTYRRPTLEELLDAKLRTIPLPTGITYDQIAALSNGYMAQVAALADEPMPALPAIAS